MNGDVVGLAAVHWLPMEIADREAISAAAARLVNAAKSPEGPRQRLSPMLSPMLCEIAVDVAD
jgi:hypothetical protein